jgi:hypothetical protein
MDILSFARPSSLTDAGKRKQDEPCHWQKKFEHFNNS